MNKITHWVKADEVTEEGLHLVCYGDVETIGTTHIAEIFCDEDMGWVARVGGHFPMKLDNYDSSYKFAKLEF